MSTIDDSFLGTLRRAMKSAGIEQHTIDKIIPEVQREWAGERPYIPVNGEDVALERRRRDDAIRRDHARGERTALLARRYGLHPGRIRHIVAQQR